MTLRKAAEKLVEPEQRNTADRLCYTLHVYKRFLCQGVSIFQKKVQKITK